MLGIQLLSLCHVTRTLTSHSGAPPSTVAHAIKARSKLAATDFDKDTHIT